MTKTVPKTETWRPTVWRFEERMVAGDQVVESWPLVGRDPDAAWQRFRLELKLHPYAYTPHSPRRLVLLAVGGAK